MVNLAKSRVAGLQVPLQPSKKKFNALKVLGGRNQVGAVSAGSKKRAGGFVASGGQIAN